MSDMLDVVKTFVSPCEKLITAVQSAIGKAYEPRYVKRMADAKAYEIAAIGQAMRDNSDIAISYDKGSLNCDTTDSDDFIKRTQKRLAFQELTKQNNIESVANQAYRMLEGCPNVENEPMDIDWLLRFFNSVQDVSNTEMQRLWAKVLAREVLFPEAVSLRTLTILAQMSATEAHTFETLASYILHSKNTPQPLPDDYFFLTSEPIAEITNMSYAKVFLLDEIGLLSSNAYVSIYFDVPPHSSEYISYQEKRVIELKNNGEKTSRISSSAYILTSAGRELLQVILSEIERPNNLSEYFNRCKEQLVQNDFTFERLPPEIDAVVLEY